MNRKIKLYHFSDKNISDRLSDKYFGGNSYTGKDKQVCNIKRIFFYLDRCRHEPSFLGGKYLYTIKINKQKLYDLRTDKLNLCDRFDGIYNIVKFVKRNYKGIIYSVGYWDIANIFGNIKIDKKEVIK